MCILSGNQQTLPFFLKIENLEEKSGFNLLKTCFDWERLVFEEYRMFSLRDPVFGFFFARANKGGYSSHLLQSRILKNVLKLDLLPMQCFSVGPHLGEFCKIKFYSQYCWPMIIEDKLHVH